MIDLVHTWSLPVETMTESFVARWGYASVGVGVFFEGEAIVVVAGAMAQRGLLSLPGVIISAFLGTLLGDQLWFHLGRRYGKAFIARRPAWQGRAARAEALLTRFGTLFVLAFRFIYGFRTITPIFLGATGYPVRRFALLNALSAALWASAFSVAGYALGASLMSVLGRATRFEELLLAAAAASLVLWIVSRKVRATVKRPDGAIAESSEGTAPPSRAS
jgi:membrane protein DedA with SNARE-associated domain